MLLKWVEYCQYNIETEGEHCQYNTLIGVNIVNIILKSW